MSDIMRLPNGELEVTIPIRLKYDGHKTVIYLPDDTPPPLTADTMNPMQKALIQGLHFRDVLEAGKAANITELARKCKMERTFLYHSLELVNLAPDIIKAILDGNVPDTFSLKKLRGNIPDDWDEQRKEFGFPSSN